MALISPEGMILEEEDAVPPDIDPQVILTETAEPSRASNPMKRHIAVEQTRVVKKTITNLEAANASIQVTYTHPAMSILGIKQYEEIDSGPFLIHVSRIELDLTTGSTLRP